MLIRLVLTSAATGGLLMLTACGAGRITACDGLVYKDGGLTRAEYLPCAGELITMLDRLSQQVEAMLSGEEKARFEAQSTLGGLQGLLKKAGGRNMLERWSDAALTHLNVDIWNATTQHQACMMVARQLFGRAPLGDEKYREAARSQCRAYRGSYESAGRAFRALR